MEAINHTVRKNAISQFLGVYGVSLLVVIGASFFLFSSPSKVYKKSIQSYEAINAEHEKLMGQTEAITNHIVKIEDADKQILNASDDLAKGRWQKNMQEAQKNIQDGLIGMKRDSISIFSPLVKRTSQGFIAAYDALLSYRNTIDYLRRTLNEQGINTTAMAKLNSELETCRREKEMYQALAMKPAGGGGGGGGEDLKKPLENCQKDFASLSKRLEDSTSVLRTLRNQKPGTVTTVNCPPCPPGGSNELQVTFDIAEELFKKGIETDKTIDKKGYYNSAKMLYQKIESRYTDPAKVKNQLVRLQKELAKIE